LPRPHFRRTPTRARTGDIRAMLVVRKNPAMHWQTPNHCRNPKDDQEMNL